MEQRDINGNLLRSWTDEDGIWAGISTINQIGGLNAINFSTPQILITNINPGQVFCVGKPVQITWVSRGVEKLIFNILMDLLQEEHTFLLMMKRMVLLEV